MKHLGTKTLSTNRYILRKLEQSDAKQMFENWSGDDEVTKYLTFQAHKNIEQTQKLIYLSQNTYDDPSFYQWNIVDKQNNEVVGCACFIKIDDDIKSAEVGYWIAKKHWGRGAMTEILTELLRFAFEEVNFNKITAEYMTPNVGSGKVLQKCGFTYEGTLRQNIKANDTKIYDVAVYSILKSEYENTK